MAKGLSSRGVTSRTRVRDPAVALLTALLAAACPGCAGERQSTTANQGGSSGMAMTSGPQFAGSAGKEVGTTPETVYHLGRGGASRVYSVEVDAENMFWAGFNLFQAPKDGTGVPVLLGGSAAGIFVLRATATHIYWLEAGVLRRTPKLGHEPATATLEDFESGGIKMLRRRNVEPEIVPLPWASAEELLLDDSYLYVALAGCAAVVRIHLGTLAQESLRLDAPLKVATGYTYLAKRGSDLYCGAWQRVFRIPDWSSIEEITSGATQIAGIAPVAERVCWLNKLGSASGDSRAEMWQWSAESGTAKLSDTVIGAGTPTRFFADDERLFWVEDALMEFRLSQNQQRIWKSTSFPSGGSAIDANYLYWTRSAPSYGTIERMRLDTP